MDRVVEVRVVHKPHQETDDTYNLGQEFSKFVKLLLQRSIFLFLTSLFDLILNSPDGCLHAGVNDYTNCATIVNDC